MRWSPRPRTCKSCYSVPKDHTDSVKTCDLHGFKLEWGTHIDTWNWYTVVFKPRWLNGSLCMPMRWTTNSIRALWSGITPQSNRYETWARFHGASSENHKTIKLHVSLVVVKKLTAEQSRHAKLCFPKQTFSIYWELLRSTATEGFACNNKWCLLMEKVLKTPSCADAVV